MNEINKAKICIIAAHANDVVVAKLISGATKACIVSGFSLEQIDVVRVAGALEIPLALNKIASLNGYAAYVVLGAIIKGETDHYHYVSHMAHQGIMSAALKYNLALGNGILTVHKMEHALDRADGACGNLGYDAALAAISLANVFTHYDRLAL